MSRILGRRWLRSTAALLALSASLVAAQAQPASAISIVNLVTDGFEDAAPWAGFYAAPGDARVITNQLGSHSGQRYGFVMEGAGSGTWASLERLVPGAGASWTCSGSVWVMPIGYDSAGRNKFNIEVIDPATFNYVSLRSVDYPAGAAIAPYVKFTFGSWRSSLPQLLFRVSQLGGDRQVWSLIDDLTITCAKL